MQNEIKTIKSIVYDKKGIDLKNILFKKDADFKSEIPERIEKDFARINKKWQEKDKKNSFKNQESLCVSQFAVKDGKVFLTFCEEKYGTRQSISETLGALPSIDQDFFISEVIHKNINIPVSYKVNVLIITKDRHIIFAKRSQKVSTNKGKIDLGVSKGAKPEDYKGRSFQPLNTALRAVKEELNLNLNVKDVIKNDAFLVSEVYINREIFSLGISCIIDLRKMPNDYTAEKIIELSKSAQNSWEMSDLDSVEFSKKPFTKFIKDNSSKLTNYSLHQALNLLNAL